MALFLERSNAFRIGIGVGTIVTASGSRANTALNAAFINGTSGPAVAVRYMPQTTDTIDEFYIFMDTSTGTLGNITMEAQIFNESSNSTRAGATSRDTSTATVMAAGDDQWIKFSFGTPYTPAVGEILWFVAYNTASAPATDYPSILTATNTAIGTISAGSSDMTGYSTTTGFTTNGTALTEIPFMVKQGSNYFGQPFTQRATTFYANNQLERGMVITPTEDVIVAGVTFEGSASYALFRILADATAPGGTALYEYDLDSDTNETTNDICGGKIFDTPVTLTGGTTYKCTFTYSGNLQLPAGVQIEDYSTYSTMFDTFRGYDTLQSPWSAIDDGAGGWTISKAYVPNIRLIVQDFPAIAGGGGGLRLAGHGGLAA